MSLRYLFLSLFFLGATVGRADEGPAEVAAVPADVEVVPFESPEAIDAALLKTKQLRVLVERYLKTYAKRLDEKEIGTMGGSGSYKQSGLFSSASGAFSVRGEQRMDLTRYTEYKIAIEPQSVTKLRKIISDTKAHFDARSKVGGELDKMFRKERDDSTKAAWARYQKEAPEGYVTSVDMRPSYEGLTQKLEELLDATATAPSVDEVSFADNLVKRSRLMAELIDRLEISDLSSGQRSDLDRMRGMLESTVVYVDEMVTTPAFTRLKYYSEVSYQVTDTYRTGANFFGLGGTKYEVTRLWYDLFLADSDDVKAGQVSSDTERRRASDFLSRAQYHVFLF